MHCISHFEHKRKLCPAFSQIWYCCPYGRFHIIIQIHICWYMFRWWYFWVQGYFSVSMAKTWPVLWAWYHWILCTGLWKLKKIHIKFCWKLFFIISIILYWSFQLRSNLWSFNKALYEDFRITSLKNEGKFGKCVARLGMRYWFYSSYERFYPQCTSLLSYTY